MFSLFSKHMAKCALLATVTLLILIQRDEYQEALLHGHLGLKLAAIMTFAGAIWHLAWAVVFAERDMANDFLEEEEA